MPTRGRGYGTPGKGRTPAPVWSHECRPLFEGSTRGWIAFFLLLALSACVVVGTMPGCASVREERHEEVPGRARTIHIDTRPVPVANHSESPKTCHPLASALAVVALGQPGERPETSGGVKYGKDGSLDVGSDFRGVITISESEGQDAKADAKPVGGSAYAKATTIIGTRIKAPPRGVVLILIGGIAFMGGVFLGFSRWLTLRSAVALSIAGAATVALGWALDSPAFGWILALVIAAAVTLAVLYVLDSKGKVDGDASIEAMAAAVNKTAPGLYEKIKAEVAAAAGKNADRVEKRVKKVKKKSNITRKAETATIGGER